MSATFEISRRQLQGLLCGEEKYIYLGAAGDSLGPMGCYLAIKKEPTVQYVPPKGCDFVPVNPLAGIEVESGTCVCEPDWGHNATVAEQYKTAGPPDDEGPGTEGGPYNRHTKWS